MNQEHSRSTRAIARLIPRETSGHDVRVLSPTGLTEDDLGQSEFVYASLEELSRHLKWLDDDYRSGKLSRLETRARSIVMLADQLGLRRVGQVAADVVYCIDDPNEVALAATLSRLMRLITQALDHAAGPPISAF
ncbi:hypothetical protein [Octadecabacter ascidiaceicola]|uniref:Uncharacterized protein n=1 Tax=Octadecabacter ascidiaceicola TaxID=1655543 RepID=A0A238KB32_9RHOB|nr:hypothetical protein [Octadecabacter ascidiaceicola]SMX40058.1 hypothetical protein OCA8868_02251 [Octadecabacter ascidiaceicola]